MKESYYVQQFLSICEKNADSAYVLIPPYALNSFLRCLEIMKEPCRIEMLLPEEQKEIVSNPSEILYKVYRKFPALVKSCDTCRHHSPGLKPCELYKDSNWRTNCVNRNYKDWEPSN